MSILVPAQVYAQGDDGMPGGDVSNRTIRAVDMAKPAVVCISTNVPGHLTVHFPPTTDVSFPQQSNGNYQLSFTGTGTFISSQGDILTADHVVEPPQDQVLNPALYLAAAQDVANYMNQNGQAGSTPITADGVVQQLTSGKLSSTPSYASPTSAVYLSTDYAGTGTYTGSDLNSVPSKLMGTVDEIKAHSSFNQQDVAIVHVPMTDTPSVALGNSDNVQQQDQLTIIGFPSNTDVSSKLEDLLTSSISTVTVSSKKTSDSGAPLIQIDSQINAGSDGGPALNGQGEIVGVVSIPLSSGNTSFLQASSSAFTLARGINLDMSAGSFEKLWSQAFEDYAATTAGHWHKAVQEFTQLTQGYPQFQAVQPFLTYAQTQAKDESVKPASATPTPGNHANNTSNPSVAHFPVLAPWEVWAIVVGAIVLLLVLGVSLFAVSMGRRKHKPPFGQKETGGQNVSRMAQPKPSEPGIATSQSPASGGTGQNTLSLKIWPCGHMNRPTARFCNVCGEAAPES